MKKIFPALFILLSFTSLSQTPQFFFARTTGKLPFLEYGIGEDRLGGAKMNYLDTNVLVKVVDSFRTKYKVQLSQYHSAYIDKHSIVPVNTFRPKEVVTGNWKVFGDSAFDY